MRYVVIKPHPIFEEYAIPEEYLSKYCYVIEYYEGNMLIGVEEYTKVREKELEKMMPIIYKGIEIKTSKFIMENVIKFEL